MQQAQFTELLEMFGYATDGTMVFVEQDYFDRADPIERDDPNFWLEQTAWNYAVRTA